MTELKTLKDIQNQKRKWRGHQKESVCAVCLKQEAIKWIKKWDEQADKLKSGGMDMILMNSLVSQINIFMYFFNITEEDLKEES